MHTAPHACDGRRALSALCMCIVYAVETKFVESTKRVIFSILSMRTLPETFVDAWNPLLQTVYQTTTCKPTSFTFTKPFDACCREEATRQNSRSSAFLGPAAINGITASMQAMAAFDLSGADCSPVCISTGSIYQTISNSSLLQ